MQRPLRDLLAPGTVGWEDLHRAQDAIGVRSVEQHRLPNLGCRRRPRAARDRTRELQACGIVRVAAFGKADRRARVREHARHDIAKDLVDEAGESACAGQRQVLLVLQPPPEVRELNRRNRAADAAVLIGVQRVFSRVEQHAVPVDVTLVVDGLVRLSPVVEGDALGPHVLGALAALLRIVAPVHGVPVEVDPHVMLDAGPDDCAGVGRRRVDRDGAARRPAAVVEPVLAAAGPLLAGALDLEAGRSRTPDVDRRRERVHVFVRDEDRQRAADAGVRVDVFGEPQDARIVGRARLVGHVEERQCLRQQLPQKRHPGIRMRPRTRTVVVLTARPVKGCGHDHVPDTLPWSLVVPRAGKIRAGEPPERGPRRRDVVCVHQLDALAVGEAVVLRIHVAAVVQLRLIAGVVHHCVEAVLVRQCEVEELEREGQLFPVAIRGHGQTALVRAGWAIASGVDLDPDRLVLTGADRHGKAAAPRTRVLWNELHRLPADRIGRRSGGPGLPHPARA